MTLVEFRPTALFFILSRTLSDWKPPIFPKSLLISLTAL